MTEAGRAAPRLAPPGRRTGEGSASILPYLLMSLASKPTPAVPDILRRRLAPDAGAPRDARRH